MYILNTRYAVNIHAYILHTCIYTYIYARHAINTHVIKTQICSQCVDVFIINTQGHTQN